MVVKILVCETSKKCGVDIDFAKLDNFRLTSKETKKKNMWPRSSILAGCYSHFVDASEGLSAQFSIHIIKQGQAAWM